MELSAWIQYHDPVSSDVRDALTSLLGRTGLTVRPVPAMSGGFGLILCTSVGDRLVDNVRTASRRCSVLVLVLAERHPESSGLWELLQAGAADVLLWPELPETADQVVSRLSRWSAVQALCESPRVKNALIGTSAAWRALVRQVVEAATFSSGPVLVTGESGTGKELIARLIHDLDPRPEERDMVIVDCTTITPELSGSEFFGHERGAFTGALNARDGAFAQANGGTLFLDEIGELPPALQTQLLRVIQEGKYKRIGSNAWQHTRFRLISATNRDLEACVADGSFRADLYYRIAGCVCRTPPLRERKEDVLELARHFQAAFDGSDGGEGFDEPVCRYLMARDYPGNVRDLRQVVARLCQRHAGPGPITIGDVPPDERPLDAMPARPALDSRFEDAVRQALSMGIGLRQISQAATDAAIQMAIEEEHGNLHRAALRLGVTDRALQLRRAQQRPSH
jgi:transcriptional regulator with GAF, ATPase, and Fis domain